MGILDMKIALIRELPLDFPGGVTHVMTLLIKYLKSRGHDVLLFAPDATVDDYCGARVVSIPSFYFPFLKKTKFKVAIPKPAIIEKALRDFEADLVHILHPMTIGLVAVYCAQTLNIPAIASYHTQYHLYLGYYKLNILKKLLWFYTQWMFNKCDRNLAPSQSVALMMKEGGIQRVDIWDRGVDTTLFSPEFSSNPWRRQFLNGNENAKIILYVGRLYKEKNLRAIIQAIKDVDNARFVFVGDGPEREYLSTVIPKGKAYFLGRLQGKALSIAFSSSDAFLFPSQTEGCPNVVMEAVASGLPVIGIDGYGVSDIVNTAHCGYLFSPGKEYQIVDMVHNLLKDTKLRQSFSHNAREFALKKTWNSVFEVLMTHYRSALLNGRTPGLIKTKHPASDLHKENVRV